MEDRCSWSALAMNCGPLSVRRMIFSGTRGSERITESIREMTSSLRMEKPTLKPRIFLEKISWMARKKAFFLREWMKTYLISIWSFSKGFWADMVKWDA